MTGQFKDKIILVTGGAGSIGSSLVREILKYEPKAVRILDVHEFSLHQMENSLPEEQRKKCRFLLGDVRDKDRLDRAMNGVHIVYHAAAYKHVHLCDYNPIEAINANVLGTQNALDAALHNNVEKFVFISTDKAANPIGTLGASKLLGEKITTAANYYKGDAPTVFSSVRFGNVTMSNGSVIPHFIKQMESGAPITVTSPKMTRFLMPLKHAVHLIFRATEMMGGGEVFVLKMKSVNIFDLATGLLEEYRLVNGKKDSKSKIVKIGMRAGEKMHEELMVREEGDRVVDLPEMLIVLPSIDPPYQSNVNPWSAHAKKVNTSLYRSDHKIMTQKQIKEFIRENKILEQSI